jgi:phage terminase large subunit-like protein
MIDIGYMQHARDRENYKGPEYQTIIFEELSEFLESQYTFMFSRLRAPRCSKHPDMFSEHCVQCRRAGLLNRIPRRVIATCNPDGTGLLWVKERFITQDMIVDIEQGTPRQLYRRKIKKSLLGNVVTYQQTFIPSLAHDNPGIDADSYVADVTSGMTKKEALANVHGWWTAREGAIFSEKQFKRYRIAAGSDGTLLPDDEARRFSGARYRFQTIDVAHTSAKKAASKRYNPSWSVIATWDYFSDDPRRMFLRDIWRMRVDWLELRSACFSVYNSWKPQTVIIEDIPGSKSLIGDMLSSGINVKSFNPSRKQFRGMSGGRSGKLDRSHEFQMMLKRGQVMVPHDDYAPWVGKYISELIMYTGDEKETSDQVDVSSMAALEVYEKPASARGYEMALRQEVDEVMQMSLSGLWSWK